MSSGLGGLGPAGPRSNNHGGGGGSVFWNPWRNPPNSPIGVIGGGGSGAVRCAQIPPKTPATKSATVVATTWRLPFILILAARGFVRLLFSKLPGSCALSNQSAANAPTWLRQ